ncbi:hypothetical protein BH23VER1_BH23VER1_23530 [soil metagenome]
MIVHLVLCKLVPETAPEAVEGMIRSTRSQLLKIGEVLSVRTGRPADEANAYPFFYMVEVESPAKLVMFLDDPIYVKFMRDVVGPHTYGRSTLNYETEPARDTKKP